MTLGCQSSHEFPSSWKNMKWWQLCTSNACQRCQQTLEDMEHIFTCPEALVREAWTQVTLLLDGWLQDQTTADQIQTAIVAGLQKWSTCNRSFTMTGLAASVTQDQLGWGLAIKGMYLSSLVGGAVSPLDHNKILESSRHWTTKLLQ